MLLMKSLGTRKQKVFCVDATQGMERKVAYFLVVVMMEALAFCKIGDACVLLFLDFAMT